MTAANQPAYDTDFLDTLSRRVMVGDGAMGTQLRVGVDRRNELGVQTSIR